jgi:hypothetical protein
MDPKKNDPKIRGRPIVTGQAVGFKIALKISIASVREHCVFRVFFMNPWHLHVLIEVFCVEDNFLTVELLRFKGSVPASFPGGMNIPAQSALACAAATICAPDGATSWLLASSTPTTPPFNGRPRALNHVRPPHTFPIRYQQAD